MSARASRNTPATTTRDPEGPAPLGASIIGGEAFASDDPAHRFHAQDPSTGRTLPMAYVCAQDEHIDLACRLAWEAFHALKQGEANDRARLLDMIADALVSLGDPLLAIAQRETGLSPSRLVAERERAVANLRLCAQTVRSGAWCDASIDPGDATRRPTPRPDVRRMYRAMGPAAMLGTCALPLASGPAGSDVASALAAGCSVVYKGHPLTPGTHELVAQAISACVRRAGLPQGAFSFLHAGGGRHDALVRRLLGHPCVRAVGFAGSVGACGVIEAIAGARPDPIPVLASTGTTNPVFLLPTSLELRSGSIAERMHGAITAFAGQQCTRPGLIFVVRSDAAEDFTRELATRMNESVSQTMLSHGHRMHLAERLEELRTIEGLSVRGGSPQGAHADTGDTHAQGVPVRCSPTLLRCTFDSFRAAPALVREVFGPVATIVVCGHESELLTAASMMQGSLAASIFAAGHDAPLAAQLAGILEARVGRLVFNAPPTGVEVCGSMVHGGPYPAGTVSPAGSGVGPLAVSRWCRPVCYQNAPETLLPPELRDANPLGIMRTISGTVTSEPVQRRAKDKGEAKAER
ncbi:MAG: aldehyde dehydrogenase family protein [Phycisphaerales bacterium]|jgi:NADP-dependent aldehyde dehydrogenase|nr:aldehyde dehydrogenase family protein [Phycisphaerales bacterium]